MFTLVLQRSVYVRVRKGVTESKLKNTFSCPVNQKVFTGAIIKLSPEPLKEYTVKVGDSYSSVAAKTGVDAETLKTLNGGVTLYPTLIIYLP